MAEDQLDGPEPVYLTLDDILELHGLIIGASAEQAGDQLRNRAGLESALARQETYAHYQEADLALQAAVLAHGIAEGQHFIDANKRTALVAMLTFLELNGWRADASDPDLELRSVRWNPARSVHNWRTTHRPKARISDLRDDPPRLTSERSPHAHFACVSVAGAGLILQPATGLLAQGALAERRIVAALAHRIEEWWPLGREVEWLRELGRGAADGETSV